MSSVETSDANAQAARWIFYIELASSALVLAYTAFVLFEDYGSPGQVHYLVAKCCQRVAYVFGQWGLRAEATYHHLVEVERMI